MGVDAPECPCLHISTSGPPCDGRARVESVQPLQSSIGSGKRRRREGRWRRTRHPLQGHTTMELPVTNPCTARPSGQESSVGKTKRDLTWIRHSETMPDLPVTYGVGRNPPQRDDVGRAGSDLRDTAPIPLLRRTERSRAIQDISGPLGLDRRMPLRDPIRDKSAL